MPRGGTRHHAESFPVGSCGCFLVSFFFTLLEKMAGRVWGLAIHSSNQTATALSISASVRGFLAEHTL